MDLYEVQVLDCYNNKTYADGSDGRRSTASTRRSSTPAASPANGRPTTSSSTRRASTRTASCFDPARMTVFHNGVAGPGQRRADRADGPPGPAALQGSRRQAAALAPGPRQSRPLPEHLDPGDLSMSAAATPERLIVGVRRSVSPFAARPRRRPPARQAKPGARRKPSSSGAAGTATSPSSASTSSPPGSIEQGFDVEISNTLDSYLDAAKLKTLDLIVQVFTHGHDHRRAGEEPGGGGQGRRRAWPAGTAGWPTPSGATPNTSSWSAGPGWPIPAGSSTTRSTSPTTPTRSPRG